MKRGAAAAKINLGLVVGPTREDGKHDLVSVYQRIALADRIELRRSVETSVTGYAGDTLVRRALDELARGGAVRLSARLEKRIPVGAGLGGGSADAAAALRLGNELLDRPRSLAELHRLAARLGSDVPFFLRDGPHLGTGDGTELRPLELPQDYWIVLIVPHTEAKPSTARVYEQFDARDGSVGYEGRRATLLHALDRVRRPRDLALLPANDLVSSPLAQELLELGAFRADVTGAGPAVYGLFLHRGVAATARRRLRRRGRTWMTVPAWYV